jgi:hypothetical protein
MHYVKGGQTGRGVSVDKDIEDLFIQPLVLPSVPQRQYFLFQQPIRTSRQDLKDREKCFALYCKVLLNCYAIRLQNVV